MTDRSWVSRTPCALIRPIILSLIAIIALLASRQVWKYYRRDISTAYAALEEAEPRTVETSFGTVEYAVDGEGQPILVAHGIVGGFDQAIQTGRNLVGEEGRVIGISRFGYLGSDLPETATPRAQARAYIELLDEIGEDDVTIVGTSAGGGPALRFALEYPERTRALVLLSAATPSEGPLLGQTGPPAVILRDWIFWTLVRFTPGLLLRLFGVEKEDFESASPTAQRTVQELLETLLPVEPRMAGIQNDSAVTNTEVVTACDEYDLESLNRPTLVIHARDDPLAAFEDAKRLAERAPNAELLAFETGGHLLLGHDDEIQKALAEFPASIST